MIKNLFRYFGKRVNRNSIWFNAAHATIQTFSIIRSSKAKFDTLDSVFDNKNSDTLVLVGGGTSLNELSREQFAYLNKFDTLAVSYGILAPLNFKYFVNEHPENGQEENQRKIFTELLKKNNIDNSFSTKIIWKSPGLYTDNLAILKGFAVFHIPSIVVKASSVKAQHRFLSCAKKLGLLHKFFFQPAGTVSAVILAAREFGYKRIITIGIDVINKEYFFMNNKEYCDLGLEDPFAINTKKESLHTYHPTVQETGTPETYVKIINGIAQNKIEIQPTSSKSALILAFKIFKFPDEFNSGN